ncbi:MAG: serine hydrolase [Candidatus Eremiobacteraeota bacterium]|nr:serine hydrolase [Candidatus Eremiobacteraeota bacterium]MBC5803401.1 serine hydrolase [Candidatus Eremiobacteraeota bacterium]MBC5822507.1 serine hydrolase [Candidatus Eremiobacteraeota bacterium]
MTPRFMMALCALALTVAGLPAQVAADPEPSFFSPAFDTYVTQAMKDWNVPGVSIAIVENGHTYTKGYGVRALGRPALVDAQTLFAIGSSSKAFTVAALGMLVDEKKIAWDDRITKHLPWFEMYDPYVTRELTIRDALTHRSGLLRGDALWYGSGLSRDDIVRRIRYIEPTWSFRSKFEYNNLMLLTAGEIIPPVTGQSWDTFVQQRLFTPLGMTSSTTSIRALAGRPDVAQPHETVNGTLRTVPYRNIDDIAPAGAINWNAVDMAHWIAMLLDGGTYGRRRLLREGTVAEMFTPQTIMPLTFPWTLYAPASHFLDYGLGWILFDYRGQKAIQHAGNIDGMSALVSMLPERHLGVTILTNKGDDFLGNAVIYQAFDDVLGGSATDQGASILKSFHGVFDRLTAAQKKFDAQRVKGTLPSLALERYAGTYRNDVYGDALVPNDGKGLRFHMLGMNGRLEHWNFDTFRLIDDNPVDAKQLITFELGPHGDVTSVSVANDPSMVFPRVAEKS